MQHCNARHAFSIIHPPLPDHVDVDHKIMKITTLARTRHEEPYRWSESVSGSFTLQQHPFVEQEPSFLALITRLIFTCIYIAKTRDCCLIFVLFTFTRQMEKRRNLEDLSPCCCYCYLTEARRVLFVECTVHHRTKGGEEFL